MQPTLAPRGRLIALCGVTFLIVGSLFQAVAVTLLGLAVLCAIMTAYLWFFPTAILLRNRKVELSWWIAPSDQPGGVLVRNRAFSLHLALRNHGARPLHVSGVRFFAARAVDITPVEHALVERGHQVEITTPARAARAAYQVIHGATVTVGDVLGLFALTAYFPNPLAVRVFPQPGVPFRGTENAAVVGAHFAKQGLRVRNQRGLAGDLSEIREHVPGDAFKYVVWKATARRQRLMVKELENQTILTHQILVDIGGTMRSGSAGRTRLDLAIELAAHLSESAIQSGDRVGLLTYDSRVFSEVKPGDGTNHHLRVVDRLIETHSVVDEDLTDTTPSELVHLVARYLAYQEAVDVSIPKPPPLDDPAWQFIQAGPAGELYDVRRLERHVQGLLAAMGPSKKSAQSPSWAWSEPIVGPDATRLYRDLRLFCRLRGIELPYRTDLMRRGRGLEAALERARAAGRCQSLTILSDYGDFLGDGAWAARALSRSRQPGARISWVFPCRDLAPGTSRASQSAAWAFQLEERERVGEIQRFLVRQGVRFYAVSHSDSLVQMVARLRGRSVAARAA